MYCPQNCPFWPDKDLVAAAQGLHSTGPSSGQTRCMLQLTLLESALISRCSDVSVCTLPMSDWWLLPKPCTAHEPHPNGS